MADLGKLDYLRGLAQRLNKAPHGGRAGLLAEGERMLGCSRQTLYRWLATEVGWKSGRKRRSDCGKLAISEEVAIKAAHLIHKATRANGKRTINIQGARNMLEDSGFGQVNPETGEVIFPKSASTLSRAMRAYGCHPEMLKQGSPHTHLRSLHPNYCWQIDPSLCVLFYAPNGNIRILDEKKYYKNKPHNEERAKPQRVWRYVIADHYSGAIYVRYVQAAGETAQGLVDVFLDAIQKRGDADPIHGVPFVLMMDKGSANTAHLFTNLLDLLGVRWITHQAGNPRAKGLVECANNIVETHFEGRLAYMQIGSMEALQAYADKWRQDFNASAIHSRTKQTRNAVWLTISEEQLRLAPPLELCRELVTTRPKSARVRADLSISHSIKGFGRNDYDLRYVNGILPQMQVSVVVNPYRAPAVDVTITDQLTKEESVWTVEPVKKDDAGFWASGAVIGEEYKALPETKAEKILKQIDEAAGADRRHVTPPEGVDVMADIHPAPQYITKRGRDLALDPKSRESVPVPLVEAAMRLKKQVGDAWNSDAYAWLQQRYPDGVPPEEIELIAARFETQTPLEPLRVVAGDQT